MGEHDNNFLEEQQKRRNRTTAVLLTLLLLVSLCCVVFAFIHKTNAEKAQAHLIECLEGQVKATEELKKAQDYSAALQYRLDVIEKNLAATKLMNEELIKRMK